MPFVHYVMLLLISALLPLAEGGSSQGTDTTREVSRRNPSDRAAPRHVMDSFQPKIMFVAQREYTAPEVGYGRFIVAVRQAGSMQQVLHFLPKSQQHDLMVRQENWPEVKKWRLVYQKQDRKQGKPDRHSKDPRYWRSPFENKLNSLKSTVENVVDIKSCEIEGSKATLKVTTKGDVVKNGLELYRTETVHMVKEDGRWLHSRTRTGKIAVGFR